MVNRSHTILYTLVIFLALMTEVREKTLAQIVPDSSLGPESSTVEPHVTIDGVKGDRLGGGAIRGSNLFHSFLEFNIKEGRGAYFLNPSGIENILTRITGKNTSKIFGTLGVLGNANLFLINPKGIIFGPNSRLELTGSFFGTTADAVNFADGTKFSATDSQAQPLLTVSIPIGLQLRTNSGSIVNQSRATNSTGETVGLQIRPEKTLSLVGGEVQLEGGYLTGEGATIYLGSVADNQTVGLKPSSQGWQLNYDGVANFQDIQLTQAAAVNVSGSRGGTIEIQGKNLTLTGGSQIRTDTLGAGQGGSLQVKAQDSVVLGGVSADGLRSGFFSEVKGAGNGGPIKIDTDNLTVANGSQISVSTFAQGQGGNLWVKTGKSVELLGKDRDTGNGSGFLTGLFAESYSAGNGGNIQIKTELLTIQGKARVSANTFDKGRGGNIKVDASKAVEMTGATTDDLFFVTGLTANAGGVGNAGNVIVNTGEFLADRGAEVISYASSSGNSGNITINAENSLKLLGATTEGTIANSFIASATLGTAKAGDVIINTGDLTLRDGGQIGSGTFAEGDSGNVVVNASRSVNLRGIEPIDRIFPSGIFSQADFNALGNGGDLTLTTGRLTLRDGARISVGTEFGSQGQGGKLTVIAKESIRLVGNNTFFIPTTGENVVTGSVLFSQSRGLGDAGEMRVKTGKFIVKDGAEVTVSASGGGTAKNLELTAQSLLLSNNSKLTAESVSGEGGNITLKIGDLLQLSGQSQISTTAGKEGGGGNGGNINIDAPFVVTGPSENSDITANAFEGRGGNINIITDGIFGIEFRPELTPLSDITASSEFGQSGFVEITAPNVNPGQALAKLPDNPVDPSSLVAQNSCSRGSSSEFIITGRGGLPPNPATSLDSDLFLVDLGPLFSEGTNPVTPPLAGDVTPATAWKVAGNGLIVLTSEPSTSQELMALVREGGASYESGDFKKAIENWQEAASAFAQQGDKLNQGSMLSNIAAAFKELGEWQQAEQYLTEALEILQAEGINSPQLSSVLAQTLNTKGGMELALGNGEKALNYWQKATESYGRSDDPIYGQTGVVRTQINEAKALLALGLNLRAVQLLEQTNTREISDELLKLRLLQVYGNALRSIGRFEESQDKLSQSLSLAQKLSSPMGISVASLGLGNVARSRKDLGRAIEYYQQAIALATNPTLKIQAQINLLSLLVSEKRILAAESLLPQILKAKADLPLNRTTIYAQINLAQTLSQLLQIVSTSSPQERNNLPPDSDIIQLLEQSTMKARAIGDKPTEAYALGYLGEEYERLRQWAKAEALTKQALILAQAIQAPDIQYRFSWQLGRILRAQGEAKGAIAAYTVAFEILQTLRSDLVTVNPEVQFSFRESVEPIYRELVSLLFEDSKQDDSQAQKNLIQARGIIESLQLAELDNFFQDACSVTKPVQIDQLDSETAVIYPIILPDRIEVIISLPGQPLRHYSSPVNQRQVETTVKKLQEALFEDPLNNQINTNYVPLAQNLYDWLIRPAAAGLNASGVKTLTFVLDGSLRNIPMAVLFDGNQYLIEKYAIALTPGLQLLEPKPLARRNLNALTAGLTEARQGFPALPNVSKELKGIQTELSSKLLLNEGFTRDSLKKAIALTPFPILHLATHGQFSSKADDTFVLTWDGRIDANDLNSLLRHSQTNRTEPVELLVLSACQTAAGDNRAALGLAGIAVRAGARSTLATLWFVDDEATSELMINFYQELAKSNATKAESLRQAQISLMKDGKHQHPFYWAPFVLVGNWL